MGQKELGESDRLVISQVQNERYQTAETRKRLFIDLENKIGRPVLTLFTSFRYDVSISDADLSVIEGLLRRLDTAKGIAIMINSPGGSGLAAERMINLLRSYSGTDDYWAIVPGQAKSAATIVCLGASKIIMGPASELGPIDPQIYIGQNQNPVSVHHVIDSYHELFNGARDCGDGHLEPYIQQLQSYDAREIRHLENQRDLATDIAIRCLRSGRMSGLSDRQIKSRLKVFLVPAHTKAHGRPIYSREAKDCGLDVKVFAPNSAVWETVYELYVRTNDYVLHNASKAVETAYGSFYMSPPEGKES